MYYLPFFVLMFAITILIFANFLNLWFFKKRQHNSWTYKSKCCTFGFFLTVWLLTLWTFLIYMYLFQIIFTEFWSVFSLCYYLNTLLIVFLSDGYINLCIALIFLWYCMMDFSHNIWNQDNIGAARGIIRWLCERKHEPHVKRMMNSGVPKA